MPIRYKVCTGPCGRSLPHTEFWKDSGKIDGRMLACKDCTKTAREERAERRASGEVVPRFTEEQKQEMSERAKRMHAEGRLGGAEFGKLGGRPRNTKIGEAVLEYFEEGGRTHLVAQAIEKALRSKSHGYRLRAAEMLIKHGMEMEKLRQSARGAGKPPEEMTQPELEEFVAQGLLAMFERGEVDLSTITLPDSAVTEMPVDA